MTFTKKQYTNLADEIETIQRKEQNIKTIMFILGLGLFAALTVIIASYYYGQNNAQELINLREMYQ